MIKKDDCPGFESLSGRHIIMKELIVMIYICPTCGKELNKKEEIAAHFLKCWKEQNPHHKSKSAPRSKDITMIKVSEDIEKFFASLQEENYERSNG